MGTFNSILWGGNASASTGVVTSLRNLAYDVLRDLGVLRAGMQPNEDQITDIWSGANRMLNAWGANRLTAHRVLRSVYSLTAALQNYTLGIGGDLDNPRPPMIQAAGWLTSGATVETPLKMLSIEERQRGVPGLYADRAFPLMNLYLPAVPVSGDQLVLYTWEPFEGFSDLETEYAFPEAMLLAIQFNLEVQVAPRFIYAIKAANVDMAAIRQQARMSKAALMALNAPTLSMRCDPALTAAGRL